MSDISPTTAASTVSSPPSTELLNTSATKGDKPLDPSLALGGNQSFNDAVEDNIQEGAPEPVETEITSQTKPPVPGMASLGGASSAVILDPASDSKNFAALMATSMIGGFSPFKEKNGSPKLEGPKATHSAHKSEKDKASEAAAIAKNKAGIGGSTTSSTTTLDEAIEDAGLISIQNQKDKVKASIDYADGEDAIILGTINQNISNILSNIQLEQASQGSAGKNRGPVLTAIDKFFGISVTPSTPASQGSLTVSLTLPNGASRTTTITTVNYGEDVGSGSVSYTKNTTGFRGQTNETTSTITTSSNTTTTSGGASLTTGEITREETGTRTTASGRTINESSVTNRTEALVDNNGSLTHIEDTRQAELYTTTGPKDHTIPQAGYQNEGRTITNSKELQVRVDKKKEELDELKTEVSQNLSGSRKRHDKPLAVQKVDIIDELNNIEEANALREISTLENIKNIMSSMQPQDKNALTFGLQAVTAAVI